MAYPIAYQLYSSRLFPPLEAQFPELKAMGYDAIEPWLPAYAADPVGFRRGLDGQSKEQAPPIYYDHDDLDGDFDNTDPARAGEDLATYLAETAAADEVAGRYRLEDTGTMADGNPVSLRWIYVHMIEETSRHVGHADILREQTDGSTGFDG